MRHITSLLYVLICIATTYSQEAVGLFSGTQNGLNSSKINPAFLFRSDNKWDLQLVGAHGFFQTNYGYINESSLLDLSLNYDQVVVPNAQGDIPISPTQRSAVFKSDSLASFFDGKSEVRGLGLMLQVGDSYKVGLSINGRGHVSSFEIPSSLNYHEVGNLRSDTTYLLQAFDVNGAAWTEYNGHVSYQTKDGHTLGTTIKYLRAYGGGFISNQKGLLYTNPINNIVDANIEGSMQFAHSGADGQLRSRGNGWAIDLGYMSPVLDSRQSRFGISVLDIGYLKFNDPMYTVQLLGNTNLDMDAYQGITTIEEFKNQLFSDFADVDSTESYTLLLPTTFSAQYVRPLTKNIGVEMSLTKRINLGDQQIKRSDMVNATLVYDRKNFSAFLPITAYDYSDFRVGAAMRLFFFTIGSDHLTSLFGTSQSFDGSDLYVNVQIYPFKKSEKDHGKRIKCYY